MTQEVRYYAINSEVPFEEDATHEFKGHRNISFEEIPDWCWIPGTDRRSRKSVSRNINAFLNTGKGGKLYLGVIDCGTVKGLHLSQYQKDHIVISVKDVLSRYSPPAPVNCCKVEFVPVFSASLFNKENNFIDEDSASDGSPETDRKRLRPHLLRTAEYCWCDIEAKEAFNQGIPSNLYVVEITVLPVKDEMFQLAPDKYHLSLHPIYEDEEGKCNFRRQASIVPYSRQEVVEQTLQEVHTHFRPVMQRLREDIDSLRQKLEEL